MERRGEERKGKEEEEEGRGGQRKITEQNGTEGNRWMDGINLWTSQAKRFPKYVPNTFLTFLVVLAPSSTAAKTQRKRNKNKKEKKSKRSFENFNLPLPSCRRPWLEPAGYPSVGRSRTRRLRLGC